MIKIFLTALVISFFCVACNSGFNPKPKSYPNITLPASHSYQQYNNAKLGFSFDYPTYATIMQDSTFFTEDAFNDSWINVDFGKYNCKVYLSYSAVNGTSTYKKMLADGTYKDSTAKNSFDKLVNDAFNLTAKHDIKSSGKEPKNIKTDQGSGGIMFYVGGVVASPIQFFITDTSTNFVRGALYYNASPNPDSTRPITQFIEKDIQHLIKSFKWQK